VKLFAQIFLILVVALSQVTVAPLFPIAGAVPDLMLVTILCLAVYSGPRTAMWAIPVAAVLVGFTSDRAPGLLLLAYLPLLPLAFALEEARLPLNRYSQVALVGVATGLWARSLLAFGAVAQDATFSPTVLVRDLLLPGALLDLALLTLVYVPFRLVGWSPRGMTLQRGHL
jgi:cell shape-determining protein MreD